MPIDPRLTVRAVDIDDVDVLDAFLRLVHTVFKAPRPPSEERREFRRPAYAGTRLSGAFDGDTLVGTFRSWDWGLTLPGRTDVVVDAISAVTVSPTHRRRGALTAMMTADLAAAVERGVCAAVLIASQATIYGRFGFGPATRAAHWTIDARSAGLRPGVVPDGAVELVDAATLADLAPPIFDAGRMPGETDRDRHVWQMQLATVPVPDEDPEHLRHVLFRDAAGTPKGFCTYSWKESWDRFRYTTEVTVKDLVAATPDAYAGLWSLLLGLDNVATVKGSFRPVDEPLPWLLVDHRGLRVDGVDDFLWTRLLDVPAALSARRYEVPGAVTLAVRDPLGHAEGRYRLEAGEDGEGRCVATDSAADVELDVDVASALWLGDGDLAAALLAGRADERTAGSAAMLARMLRTTRAPWTGTWF